MHGVGPDEVAARLGARTRRPRSAPWAREAAVLVPLTARDGETLVLLTERDAGLRHHAGQIAFPGGRRDPEDVDAVATALREAHEEVGLHPSAVRVLGLLDDVITSTDFVVTPVVAWYPQPTALAPNPAEVARVLELPLAAFTVAPRARTVPGNGHRRIVLPFEVRGHVVWGATAAVLRDLAAALRGAP